MSLHHAARGFGHAVEAYERGRPEYPREVVDAAVGALRVVAGTRVLDLGAGTGKLSRVLAERGATVVAVDPVDGMIRRAAGTAGILPVRAVAEAVPSRASAFEGVCAASAFHWFDGPRALREIHRVLRPGGRLALVWNQRDDAVPWVARLSEIVNRHEGDTPRYRKGGWRAAFDAARGLFGPLAATRFRHVHALSPAAVVDRVASISFVAAMPGAERAGVLAEVRTLLASHPDTAGKDEVALVYVTDVYWCERVTPGA